MPLAETEAQKKLRADLIADCQKGVNIFEKYDISVVKPKKKSYVIFEYGVEDEEGLPSGVMILSICNSEKEAEKRIKETKLKYKGIGIGWQIPDDQF